MKIHTSASGSSEGRAGRLICGDVLDVVPTLDDESINLVVTSPPYAEQRSDHYPGVPEREYPRWMARVMAALRPKLTLDASVLMVIRPHVRDGQISDYTLRTRLAIRDAGYCEVDELIWLKRDAPPNGSRTRHRRTWESVHWFAPGPRPYCDVYACGRPSHRIGNVSSGRFGLCRQLAAGMSPVRIGVAKVTDVIDVPVGGLAGEPGVPHPAMFPQRLAAHLINTFSRPSNLVLDLFAGSGQTLLAAQSLGRRWIGIDIVPDYIHLARRRLLTSYSRSSGV